MADISRELKTWKEAIHGEDVRDAQIGLSNKLNTEVEKGTTKIASYEASEGQRIHNENARVQAEQERQQATNQAVNRANDASANAEVAYDRLKDTDVSHLVDDIDNINADLTKTVKIFDHEALKTVFNFDNPHTPAGIHRLAGSNTFTNAPSGVDVGWANVLVIRVPGGVLSMQIFPHSANSIYLRSSTITNWTSKGWAKVVTEQGANTFTGRQIMKGSVGVNANSWSDSSLLIQAPYNENSKVRAGFAFDNTGNNAAYLYFDITGQLKLVDNAGNLFEIQMTKIN
jgi:hypothetical protein